MKTTYDAVNELKGDINNSWEYRRNFDNFIFFGFNANRITAYPEMERGFPDQFKYICTVIEFNDLVSQMETNFGKVTHGEYYDYVHGNKKLLDKDLEVMDIDWSKAPEGATHYHKKINAFFEVNDKCISVWKNDIKEWESTLHSSTRDYWIAKPALTYTQAMADNGELPSVGMEVVFKHDGYDVNGIVTAITKEFIVLTEESGKERTRKLSESPIKPLTPPIEPEEQTLNDMMEQLKNEGICSYDPIMLRILIAKFKANKIHGVSFQPLTVEVK